MTMHTDGADEGSVEWGQLEDLARNAFDEGDLHRARDLLERAAASEEAGPSVFSNLGLVNLELGDYARAIRAYDPVISGDVDARVNRGLAYERIGDKESARVDYLAALALDPDEVAALINLGTLDLERGAVEIARDALERAAALDPTAGWQLADVFRAIGDLDSAASSLNRAIQAGEFRAYLDLASVEEERGNSEASQAAYAAAAAHGWERGDEDAD